MMSGVLAPQRHDLILSAVRRDGAVRVADLVAELGVSDMTIRRDIGELARQGLVQRVHGGAVDSRRAAHEPGFRAKVALESEAKRAIAAAAAGSLEPGAALGLSGGTTTHLIATAIAALPHLRPLTVVTNSLPAAAALSGDPGLSVVLTGGSLTISDALVGPVAVAALELLRIDVLFLGVHGMDVDAGLTTPNLLEAETDRALMTAAARTVVVADHTKWGVVGLSRIADLSEVDLLVTDQLPGAIGPAVQEATEVLVTGNARGDGAPS